MELLIIAIGVIILAAFALAATELGVDSRVDDNARLPHSVGLA